MAGTLLLTMIQFLQSSESKKPYVQWNGYTQKYTDQESKNKEVIEGIPERDLENFRLVRLILDSVVQVSTTWRLEKKLIVLTVHWKRKTNIYWLKLSYVLQMKLIHTESMSQSYISQLNYTSKPG